MTAGETLYNAIEIMSCCANFSPYAKPGENYAKLPQHMRDSLKNLKSDEISTHRMDLLMPFIMDGQWRWMGNSGKA